MCLGLPTQSRNLLGLAHEENEVFLSPQPFTASSFSSRDRALVKYSRPCWCVNWYGLVQAVTLLRVCGSSTPAMSGRHCLTEVLVFWLLQSFCPSSRMFPEPRNQGLGLCCRWLYCSDSPISLRPKFLLLLFSLQKFISEVINLDHVPDHTVGLVGVSIN